MDRTVGIRSLPPEVHLLEAGPVVGVAVIVSETISGLAAAARIRSSTAARCGGVAAARQPYRSLRNCAWESHNASPSVLDGPSTATRAVPVGGAPWG